MKLNVLNMWEKIACSKFDLQLKYSLTGGQSFRWKLFDGKEDEWIGVFHNCIWKLSQNDTHLLYQIIEKNQHHDENTNYENLLRKYFRLDLNLNELYKDWSNRDEYFKEVANNVQGVRILAQDPIENIFSFICSANNNISRITSMVERMCSLYGSEIGQVNGSSYFTFPEIEKLASPSVEADLRKAGFGYRAKFINQSAKQIIKMGGNQWLETLKTKTYPEAKEELMKLTGIGAKVADCICLMSLGHLEATPVDTHILQMVSQRYMPHLKNCKSLTNRVYNEIVDYSQKQFGPMAGWAHTVLFCAELKMFKEKSDQTEPKAKKRRKK